MKAEPVSKAAEFGVKLGLTEAQAAKLAQLRTPALVQDFISRIPTNFELGGETNLSVFEVMQQRRAHCLEGAFVAACALWMQGMPPLLMNLRATNDDDHAVVLFRRGRSWGSISKSNHVWLRWRDPVYRSPREIAVSYIHEYVSGVNKTLSGYSAPFDLRRFDPAQWVSSRTGCWAVAEALAEARHFRLLSPAQTKNMRPRDAIELEAGKILEHPAPSKKLMMRY